MFASRLVEERLNGTLEADMHGACTVRYDDETVRSVIAALEHARQLLQASIPHFVTRTPSKRVKSARADARFVKFLSGIGLAPNAGRSD